MRAESFDVKAEALEREALGSVKRDTVYHIWALGQVRSYRNDFQIACDTLYVNGRDSLFTLQGKPYPYLWNGKSQISAEHIAGYLGKQGVDSMHFEDKVFVGMHDRGGYYNQMTGLVMRAYLYDNKLRIIRMEGEGDVIFFMREDEDLIGVNRIKSPRYKIEVVDNEASEAVFYTTTESVMLPPAETAQDAVDNDVHMVGFSSLAAGHNTLLPQLVDELKKLGRDDIMVCIGGVIPVQDYDNLYEHGAVAIFAPGTNIPEAGIKLLTLLIARAKEEAAG